MYKVLAPAVIGGFFGLSAVFGSWYIVDEGERAVVLRYGKIVDIAEPGLGFKLPLLDSVKKLSVQDQVSLYPDLEAYSRDQQPATMTVSVNYRLPVDQIEDIYRTYGSREALVDRLITRKVLEEVKTVFGTYNAETSIRERGRLNTEIRTKLQESVDGPVFVIGVQIEEITFSSAYEQSVEQRMLAEVAVQRENQLLEKEKVSANIVRETANGERDRIKALADAEAYQIESRGKAEAKAIDLRAVALAKNPAIIKLVEAERWNGAMPSTMMGEVAVPIFNTK